MNGSGCNRKLTTVGWRQGGRVGSDRASGGVKRSAKKLLRLMNRLPSAFLLSSFALFFLTYLFIHFFEVGSHPGWP